MPGPRGPAGRPSADAAAATPPTLEQIAERVFTRFDADDSDTLALTELLAVLDPAGNRIAAADRAAAAIDAIDANGDALISRDEFGSHLARLDSDGDGVLERSDRSADDAAAFDAASVLMFARAAHRGGGPRSVDDVADRLMTRFDADASTTIALSELLAVLDPQGNRSELAADVTALFNAVDANTDAALSRDEVHAALAQLDTDGDGLLERGEHAAADAGDAVALIGIVLHGGPGHGFGG